MNNQSSEEVKNPELIEAMNAMLRHNTEKTRGHMAAALMEHLGRGVTGIPSVGMYSGQKRKMLYCVVSRREIVTLKELVLRADPAAFLTVTDAREVLGEGFQEYES